MPALEEEAPLMLEEEAGEGNVRKEKKEKHKKDKKHKHKHKHKSGHKRHRDDEDAAEVENVHAAVKPHSAEPETRSNGKATHDVAEKCGSDCESGEIPTAEDGRGEALESIPAGKPAEASRTTGRSLEAADQQSNGGSTRCGSVCCWTRLQVFPVGPYDRVLHCLSRAYWAEKWPLRVHILKLTASLVCLIGVAY